MCLQLPYSHSGLGPGMHTSLSAASCVKQSAGESVLQLSAPWIERSLSHPRGLHTGTRTAHNTGEHTHTQAAHLS